MFATGGTGAFCRALSKMKSLAFPTIVPARLMFPKGSGLGQMIIAASLHMVLSTIGGTLAGLHVRAKMQALAFLAILPPILKICGGRVNR
jgi:hypothetical protein